ncbi:DUF1800 family protein [uncultured Thiohalocapsa sp.]|uniref:DUF1800 family protein n=1 Tax=uncultured Thiohalocapsa sp. TaxID=768990 RepID=UPI0025E4AE6D|nr:DUF1800 family protein [uncultured Thiohalocapsa sp.]
MQAPRIKPSDTSERAASRPPPARGCGQHRRRRLPRLPGIALLAATLFGAGAAVAVVADLPPAADGDPSAAGTVGGGVFFTWYSGRFHSLPDFAALTPSGYGVAPGFGIDPVPQSDDFAVRYTGFLTIPAPGEYRFYTRSDDGSDLLLDGERIVNNDGRHGMRTRWSEPVRLDAGDYPIEVGFFEATGDAGLEVGYEGPDGSVQPIDPGLLAFAAAQMPEPRPADDTAEQDLYPGVAYSWHDGRWDRLPDFTALTPDFIGVADGFDSAVSLDDNTFALRFQGYIEVPEAGIYSFYTTSDDGSALYIGDKRVVDNDGRHGPRERAGSIALAAGLHRITVDHFQGWGGAMLEVDWSGPGFARELIPAEALSFAFDLLPPMQQPVALDEEPLPGLAYRYAEGHWDSMPDLDTEEVLEYGVVAAPGLTRRMDDNRYAFSFRGYLQVDTAGVYAFTLNAKAPVQLWIGTGDDAQLVAERERHWGNPDVVGALPLAAGLHPIRIDYYERWGGDALAVGMQGPDDAEPQPLPATALFHTASQLPAYLAAQTPAGGLRNGLAYAYAEGKFSEPPDFATLAPGVHGVADGLDLGVSPESHKFALQYTGYIEVPQDGHYRFFATADDGVALSIAGTPVLLADRPNREAFGSIGLEAGLHAFELTYHQRWGDTGLALSWQLPDGSEAAVPAAAFSHTPDQLPTLAAAADPDGRVTPGLAYREYAGSWHRLPDFATLTPVALGVSPGLDLARATTDRKLGLRFEGYIRIAEPGFHRFHLTSDDGSRLWIGDTLVVDNDGRHGPREAMGSIGLKAGLHPIRVDFFQGWGGMTLALDSTGPDGVRAPVAASDLFHTSDQLPPLRPAAAAPDAAPVPAALPGLAYELYLGNWRNLPAFGELTPAGVGIAAAPDLGTINEDSRFGVRYRGWLRIDDAGWYDFRLGSDDGSRLRIGDTVVVDNDGLHSYRQAAGSIGLAAGWHPIEIQFFERYGDERLTVEVRGPDGERGPLPADALMLDPAVLPDLQDAGANAANLVGGVDYAYYEGRWRRLPDFDTLTPVATGVADGFTLAPRQQDDHYGFVFQAYIDIPEYGHYELCTRSDDGSRLFIGDTLVVDNDGLHAARTRCGRIGLDRGRHAIRVTYFERGGDDSLEVTYAGPRFGTTPVTADVLFRLDPDADGPGTPPDGGPGSALTNTDPMPAADTASTGIGRGQSITVAVLANDRDMDGDILVLTGADATTAAGAAVLADDGKRLVYTPPLGFTGTDVVHYGVGDRRGGSAVGTLTVEVGAGETPVMSAGEAVRFLNQASFGATREDIATVMTMGPEAWIDAQLALPASGHEALFEELSRLAPDADNRRLRVNAWLRNAVTAEDQLRQRMAFALSQIFVISDLGNVLSTDAGALGAVHYYDMLVDGAFGRYRDLLEQVTLHPAMGFFLDTAGNVKADPVTATVPDENYAREVLQLFSIGLWELTPNGEQVLDAAGEPIPTYTGEDLMQYARVFTGWDYATERLPEKWRLPMVLDPAEHEQGMKVLLDPAVRGQYEPIPPDLNLATADPTADLTRTLDNIAAHRNVAPFIGRQLIQRFVTSNPSPDYVGRVADAFRASDGDLGETLKAVLLDTEARSGAPDPLDALAADLAADAAPAEEGLPGSRAFGKMKEPLLQLTGVWRALGVDPDATAIRLAELAPLGQVPLSAPSVFNFFKPDYQAPGEIADLGLYSPELEIINEEQITGAVATMDTWTLGATQAGADWYNLSMELAMADGGVTKIIDHLDLLFLGGAMSDTLRAVLATQVFYDYARQGEQGRVTRVLAGVYLIVTSPEYLIEE